MEPVSLIDTIFQFISGFLSYETLKNFAPIVALAAIISAFTSSKATHKNPVIKGIIQLVKDLINIAAFNIVKAKNQDDV